ncbi:MAG: helix-turn-helix transcriptional regulator [bacterium]
MIGNKIKELRKRKGWTQQKLTEESKLSYSLICKIEQDVVEDPGINTIRKIADALNVSIDSLVGRKFPKK